MINVVGVVILPSFKYYSSLHLFYIHQRRIILHRSFKTEKFLVWLTRQLIYKCKVVFRTAWNLSNQRAELKSHEQMFTNRKQGLYCSCWWGKTDCFQSCYIWQLTNIYQSEANDLWSRNSWTSIGNLRGLFFRV